MEHSFCMLNRVDQALMPYYCCNCKIELSGGDDDPNKCASNHTPIFACHNCYTWGPTRGDGDNPWYEKEACKGCKNRLLSGEFKATDRWKPKAEEMIAVLGGPWAVAAAKAKMLGVRVERFYNRFAPGSKSQAEISEVVRVFTGKEAQLNAKLMQKYGVDLTHPDVASYAKAEAKTAAKARAEREARERKEAEDKARAEAEAQKKAEGQAAAAKAAKAALNTANHALMPCYCRDCKIEVYGGDDDPNKCASCHNCYTWGPTRGDGDNPWYEREACKGCKNRLLSGEFKASKKSSGAEGLIAKAEEMITKLGGPVGAAKAKVGGGGSAQEQEQQQAGAQKKAEGQAAAAAAKAAKAAAEAKAEAKAKAEAEAQVPGDSGSLGALLVGVGVKTNKVDAVLEKLKENEIEDADDLKHLDAEDISGLGLSVLHAKLVTKLLSDLKMTQQSPTAAAPQPEEDAKFAAPKLVMGPAGAAARGIQAYLGIDDLSFTKRGLEAIEAEWREHGTEDELAYVLYVLYGTARHPPDIPKAIKAAIAAGKYHGGVLREEDFDTGNDGKKLQDFVDHPDSRMAELTPPEVASVRIYTSPGFRAINKPLRDKERPHRVGCTVYFLTEGLKKLRAVGAEIDPEGFNEVKWLWRGIKDKSLDYEKFKKIGGTELAPMSTTEDKTVALAYAASERPLVFKYKTVGLGRG